jgi:uncharacterized protein (DUF2252 family)
MPRSAHGQWEPSPDRPDPLALLQEHDADRLTQLVPIKYGRMMESPFAFFRGAAAIMAWDLSRLPRTEITVQLSGDAHLANFGFFGSPERRLLFDMNDFDETLPGPWEWDVKRLVASAFVAARSNGCTDQTARKISSSTVSAYRQKIAEFAEMTTLEVWFSHVTAESLIERLEDPGRRRLAVKRMERARQKDSRQAILQLTTMVDGIRRIVESPPLIERLPEEEVAGIIRPVFAKYEKSLSEEYRSLLGRFQYVDSARRVGGVGSVGTRCYIVVLVGRDEHDPLVLQLKESGPSVLASYLPQSKYANEGQRVVSGQRLIQGASDPFLGWLRYSNNRQFYFRQLWNMKASAKIAEMSPSVLEQYARSCAELLARAHSRSGDGLQIQSYLGKSDRFDQSVAEFARRYADQTEQDHERLLAAVRNGRIEAHPGL